MRLISKRARDDVHFGDMVITSGIGGGYGAIYPADINIGRVSRIFYKEDETSMEVELETVLDFSRLEYVFVIDAASPDTELPGGAMFFDDEAPADTGTGEDAEAETANG
jgi:rod shape-determining protein MreC